MFLVWILFKTIIFLIYFSLKILLKIVEEIFV